MPQDDFLDKEFPDVVNTCERCGEVFHYPVCESAMAPGVHLCSECCARVSVAPLCKNEEEVEAVIATLKKHRAIRSND